MKWTMAIIAAVMIPTFAAAQQPAYGRDTSRGQPKVRTEARGAVERSRPRGARGRTTWGLSTSQLRQLQQALQGIDCYDGTIDGVIGPKTRAGIACAMRHHNVTGEDPNALLEALGLNFQVDAKAGLGSVMRSGAARPEEPGARGDRPRDTTRNKGARDTLQGKPTTTPTPQNVPPR